LVAIPPEEDDEDVDEVELVEVVGGAVIVVLLVVPPPVPSSSPFPEQPQNAAVAAPVAIKMNKNLSESMVHPVSLVRPSGGRLRFERHRLGLKKKATLAAERQIPHYGLGR